MTRAIAAAAFTVMLLGAPAAHGAVTVGQTAPVPPTNLCGTGNSAQSTEAGPPSYVIPSSGVITAWQHRAHASGGDGRLLVWEGPVSPLTLVGRSEVAVYAGGQLQSFATRVPVSAGDVLGLRVHSINASCTFFTGAGDNVIATGGAPDLAPGDSMTTSSTLPNQRVNVSATLEPDADLDGFGDESQDNCAAVSNPSQVDYDLNGRGDACDAPSCAGRVATIVGTAGPDRLKGTRRRDVIATGAGEDRIKGRKGKDILCGGDGNDLLFGGLGRDLLIGGPGVDLLRGGKGKDRRQQ